MRALYSPREPGLRREVQTGEAGSGAVRGRGCSSFDYREESVTEDLRRHLGFFPEKEVVRVELQVYDPALPTRYRYERRPDLEELVRAGKGT